MIREMWGRFNGTLRGAVPKRDKAPLRPNTPERSKAAAELPPWVGEQRERMAKLWKSEKEWEEAAQDLLKVLPPEIASHQVVNVGAPEVKGFDDSSEKEVPKVRCDDRIINDPERGVFAVLDGVSTGHGAIAAEITSRVVGYRMGEGLDEKIKVARETYQGNEAAINAVVAQAMQAAVREAHEAVQKINTKKMNYKGACTTLSLTKLVAMPNGQSRLYYTNIGDSRIYLEKEGGQLVLLTKDDSVLNSMVAEGDLDAASLRRIDQCSDAKNLTIVEQGLADRRNEITEAIGSPNSRKPEGLRYDPNNSQDSDILFVDLQPGQRFVITSDGVHDNATENQMSLALRQDGHHNVSTLYLQRALQDLAVNIQRDRANYRSKPDDAAAVVGEAPVKQRQPVKAGNHVNNDEVARQKSSRTERQIFPLDSSGKELSQIDEAELAAQNKVQEELLMWEAWRHYLVKTGIIDTETGRVLKRTWPDGLTREQVDYIAELQRQVVRESGSGVSVISAKKQASG